MKQLAWLIVFAIPLACSDDGVSPADTEGLSGGTTGDLGGTSGNDGPGTAADDGGATGSAGGDDSGTGDATGGGGPGEPGYCEGVRPWSERTPLCFDGTECLEGDTCSPTGDPGPQCGACMAPQVCKTSDECFKGEVCGPAPEGPCICPQGPLACVPACPATPCGEDDTCQPDGVCAPRSCEDDWACAETHVCDPLAKDADGHGCAPLSCADGEITCDTGFGCGPGVGGLDANGCALLPCDDPAALPCAPNFVCTENGGVFGCWPAQCVTHDDCECGSCVLGFCNDGPGVCVPPPPP